MVLRLLLLLRNNEGDKTRIRKEMREWCGESELP